MTTDNIRVNELAKELFGENYACAKLPTVEINGTPVQMSGFGGFKLLGVKPQTEDELVKAYLETAGKFGYDLKAEDITAAIGELKKKQAAATEKALKDEEELSDENLTAVAGGGCSDFAFMAGDAQKITCGDALDIVKQAFCTTVYW